ncbi:Hypothetical predicted protein [Marmota monax]|uniref:Uncharacterized protein n=1 Tax=Marmota monax TaxID=9995 RepID=A0A5E4CWQ1_MARMO|nr:hypothetical protein GHT09_014536 [Marmota monax]VTJ85579.1 Hypothetical predicted protein [Marmota monax]
MAPQEKHSSEDSGSGASAPKLQAGEPRGFTLFGGQLCPLLKLSPLLPPIAPLVVDITTCTLERTLANMASFWLGDNPVGRLSRRTGCHPTTPAENAPEEAKLNRAPWRHSRAQTAERVRGGLEPPEL